MVSGWGYSSYLLGVKKLDFLPRREASLKRSTVRAFAEKI